MISLTFTFICLVLIDNVDVINLGAVGSALAHLSGRVEAGVNAIL